MTFHDASKEFELDCKVRHLSPKTIDNYTKQLRYLENHLSSEFSVLNIEDVKPAHIKSFMAKMDDAGRKPQYINQENILQVDVSFGSPSYAASFVIGRNSNGLTEWKNKEGVSLKEMNEGTSAGKKKPPNTRGTYSKPTSSFEPVVQPANLLYLASKKVTATAYISGDQIVVVKGSQISPVERKTCRPWVRNMRDALVKEGKVVNYVFTVDTPFSSPSAAAAAILGGESNGQTLWRNENGKTLKELSTK